MKVYVASSWKRTARHQEVVRSLRAVGHDVYDYRNPAPGNNGFRWSSIDPNYRTWTVQQFKDGLDHPLACQGFKHDMDALMAADACVCVLPCGDSAHLELGYARGGGKISLILLEEDVPELMYKMLDGSCATIGEVIIALDNLDGHRDDHDEIEFPCECCGEREGDCDCIPCDSAVCKSCWDAHQNGACPCGGP